MNWNKASVSTLLVGVALIVGGGFLAKLVSLEAGAALFGSGVWMLGWLKQQPAFAQAKGAAPEKEVA